MIFYFKIGYTSTIRWIFGRYVSFKILSVAIVSENGDEFFVENKRLGPLRFELGQFLTKCLGNNRYSHKVVFIGHHCATEHLLMEQIWPWRTNDEPILADLVDELNVFADSMPDSCFSLESDYSFICVKDESERFSLSQKLDMIASHPEYPPVDNATAIAYAKWISDVHKFPIFRIHLIGLGFTHLFNQRANSEMVTL